MASAKQKKQRKPLDIVDPTTGKTVVVKETVVEGDGPNNEGPQLVQLTGDSHEFAAMLQGCIAEQQQQPVLPPPTTKEAKDALQPKFEGRVAIDMLLEFTDDVLQGRLLERWCLLLGAFYAGPYCLAWLLVANFAVNVGPSFIEDGRANIPKLLGLIGSWICAGTPKSKAQKQDMFNTLTCLYKIMFPFATDDVKPTIETVCNEHEAFAKANRFSFFNLADIFGDMCFTYISSIFAPIAAAMPKATTTLLQLFRTPMIDDYHRSLLAMWLVFATRTFMNGPLVTITSDILTWPTCAACVNVAYTHAAHQLIHKESQERRKPRERRNKGLQMANPPPELGAWITQYKGTFSLLCDLIRDGQFIYPLLSVGKTITHS